MHAKAWPRGSQRDVSLRVLWFSNLPDSDSDIMKGRNNQQAWRDSKQSITFTFRGFEWIFILWHVNTKYVQMGHILTVECVCRVQLDVLCVCERDYKQAATIASGISSSLIWRWQWLWLLRQRASSYLGPKTILGASRLCPSLLSGAAYHGRTEILIFKQFVRKKRRKQICLV